MFVAHPDDVEYGVLGSMIKFGDTKFDVVVLSNGGDFDVTTGNSRFDECRWIWNKLNNINGNCLDSLVSEIVQKIFGLIILKIILI